MSMHLRIRQLRESLKMTGKDFSDLIGIDNSQYSKIEKGKIQPTIAQIMEISSKIGVSIDWLLTGEGESSKDNSIHVTGNRSVANTGHIGGNVVSESRIPYNVKGQENEIEKLNRLIIEKDALLKAKDEIIKSKDEIIKLLKDQLVKS